MRALLAAALIALGLSASAAADDVPTTPTATQPAPTTTAPAPVPPPSTTTAPAATTTAPATTTTVVTTTTSAPTTTTAAPTTTARRAATTTAPRRPRIAVPQSVSGSYEEIRIVPVPAHVEGVLRTLGLPLGVTPPLSSGPYVFPVAGEVSWGDSYGGPRSDVAGGWHHGDDLFARLGQPVLAVADGRVYKVGWERLGGWRLWLRDREGNRFYYAHLSGYAPLAQDGAVVKAGDVIGYIGHTGDAFTTPWHLHFEIHPVSLLWLRYNGAVDPTSYLSGWRHVEKAPLPVPAPLPVGAATHGEGAVSDYRRLLSLFRRDTQPAGSAATKEVAAAAPVKASRRQLPAARGSSGTSRWPLLALAASAAVLLTGLPLLVRHRRSGSARDGS